MEEMLPIHRTIDYLFKLLVLKGSRFSFAEHKILNLLFIFSGLLPIFFSLTVFRLFKTLKKNVLIKHISTYKKSLLVFPQRHKILLLGHELCCYGIFLSLLPLWFSSSLFYFLFFKPTSMANYVVLMLLIKSS